MTRAGIEKLHPRAGVEHYLDPLTSALLAIVVRSDFQGAHHNFLTPDEFPIQVGINFYSRGDVVPRHRHHPQERHLLETHEFILLRKGRAALELFSDARELAHRVELRAGDAVLLTGGGHGLELIDDAELLEVKQGPYLGVADKERF